MSWLASPEFKVGFLVVAVSVLIAGMAMKVAEGPGLFSGKRNYYFRADSAGGLVPNSAVKMAGIKVGVIDKIELENGRARILLAIEKDPKVTNSARVELRGDGILGDKHVELVPGKDEDPDLPPGSELVLGGGKGGMDDLMGNANQVVKSIQELVDAFNKAFKAGDDTTTVGRIVGNIEKITADLKQVSGENKEGIREIVERIRSIAKNIDSYVNEESLGHLDHALKNIDDVTTKINKGEGTLGRLINDEETIEQINTAVENINNFLGGAQKMETSVDFHSEFMTNDENKSYLGLRIQPGLDRYYEVAAVSDTLGVTSEEVDTTGPVGSRGTTTFQKKTYKNNFKLTAIFAKNFWDFTVKGGLIENYGGGGIDYYVLGNRDLRLSVEAFDFKELNIRAFVKYNFFKGFYVMGGGDNLLGKGTNPVGESRRAAAFIGAGIFVTNDDLKTLSSKFSFK